MLSWLIAVAAAADIAEIDIATLQAKREAGEIAVLLDVRTEKEIIEVRVPGIVHIPLDQLPKRLDELDKETPVHVICHSGGRSAKATELLGAEGFTATNVAGGTAAWVAAGYAVERGPLDLEATPAE
ncbi:MAG TPA: rhodanese-like domain-containing protein [Myxococcota bacterium]|nr:rhodanese-like domain-containing protein [Myxococcota bacterium]